MLNHFTFPLILLLMMAVNTWAQPAPIPGNRRIAIRAQISGLYVSADLHQKEADTHLYANRNTFDQWELFNVIDLGDHHVALQAIANGQYLCAYQNASQTPIIANRQNIADWEIFLWQELDDSRFALKAKANNQYVSVQSDMPKAPLLANQQSIGKSETFTWIDCGPTPAPRIVGKPTIASTSNGTTLSFKVPTGMQHGDVLVAFVRASSADESQDLKVPAGWSRVGPAFIPKSKETCVNGWWIHTVSHPMQEAQVYDFSVTTPSQMAGILLTVRGNGSAVQLVSTNGSPFSKHYSDGAHADSVTIDAGGATPLLLFCSSADFAANGDMTPKLKPVGFDEVAFASSSTNLATARTAMWIGSRIPSTGGADSATLAFEGVNTAPVASQIAFANPSQKPVSINPDARWKLVTEETWDTHIKQGQWAKSVYAKRYPTYEGFVDTSNHGTYHNDNLSVSNGVLDVHVRTVNGKHQVAAITLGPNGYKGQTYGRYALRIKADVIPRYKIAPLLWPASNKWDDGEIDFPEVDAFTATAHVKAKLYMPHDPKVTSWSGWDNVGSVMCDDQWHDAVIEWTPEGVDFYWDNQHIGRASGPAPKVPMRWTLQIETQICKDMPDNATEGHVYIGKASIWSYQP